MKTSSYVSCVHTIIIKARTNIKKIHTTPPDKKTDTLTKSIISILYISVKQKAESVKNIIYM